MQSTDFAQKLWTNNESSDADEGFKELFILAANVAWRYRWRSSGDVEAEGKEGAAAGPSSWAWTDVVRYVEPVAMASAEDPLQATAA